jgi:cobalt-zinc-cadmium efflux system outer membrane protein
MDNSGHHWLAITLLAAPSLILAQQPSPTRLTLTQAREAARTVSSEVRAARAAVAAAAGRERQAGAYANPTLSYDREQTSASGGSNSHNIAALEQRVEFGGIRGARIDAARLRREAAEERLAAVVAQVDFETARAYALVLATDRRATLAEQAAEAFGQALGVSERRLAAGDVSGYANRRLRLEAARYATLRAEALLSRRTARLELAALVGDSASSITAVRLELLDSLPSNTAPLSRTVSGAAGAPHTVPDSLIALAFGARADLRVLEREAAAARADAQQAARERIPVPAFSVGFKNEHIAGVPGQSTGFVAGVSLPLPLWDRRAGTIAATDAESARRAAESDALKRRIAREVGDAYDAYVALGTQLRTLAPHVGAETSAAMRAVQVAYSEGEVTLVEWLDAVRAYQEAESSYATLRGEALIRRAELERAVGLALTEQPNPRSGANAPDKD